MTFNSIFSLNNIIETKYNSRFSVAEKNKPSWPENATHGYVCGGSIQSGPETGGQTDVIRINLNTETVSFFPNILPEDKDLPTAGVFSLTHGYIVGADNIFNPSIITKLQFSNETVVDVPYASDSKPNDPAGVSASDYGYVIGRLNSQRIEFANDTNSTWLPGLIELRLSASTRSHISGYFGGGDDLDNDYLNTVFKVNFSDETFFDSGANLPSGIEQTTGVSGTNYGYYCGGRIVDFPFYTSQIARLDFSNETVSSLGNLLPSVRSGSSGIDRGNYGYICGGEDISPDDRTNQIAKFDFINETVSVSSSTLPTPVLLATGLNGVK